MSKTKIDTTRMRIGLAIDPLFQATDRRSICCLNAACKVHQQERSSSFGPDDTFP